MNFRDIAAFRAFLRGELPGRINEGISLGLVQAGEMIAGEMRGELGTYQKGDAGFEDWVPLSNATLEGFGPVPPKKNGDTPLLEDGTMRDSIGYRVHADGVEIGTDDPVAVFQDQGTERRGVPFVKDISVEPGVPGREFVGRAGFRKAPEAADAIGAAVAGAMVKP